jgi:drug/metabolite transporter (DMT)-like permease
MHIIYYFYAFLAVALTGICQVLLKMGAKNTKTFLGTYINIYSLIGYFSFILVTIFTLLALREMDLKLLYILASTSYIVVAILSRIFLKEQLSRRRIFSLGAILIGVLIFNL